jgi:signal transduction histidine kinase
MGPPGSVCWTLVGAALIAAAAPAGSPWRRVTSALAQTTAAITVLSITGYLYGVDRLYSLPFLTVIAFQTAIFIAAVSLALIAAVPERAPMRWLIDPGGAGEVARRALPFILLVPMVVGWLWLRGERAGLYDTRFGAAAFVLLLIGLLLGLLAMNLRTIARHEEALREADRRKNEFLAILAHELRNPLAPISNVVHILRFVGGDAAAVRQSAETLDRQVKHMVRLVDDLLDVSRITRGTIELRRRRIELQPLVAHSVETARALCRDRGDRIEVHQPREPIYLEADAARLTQVIDNLLSNACKFSSPGGRIEVRVDREGEQAVLRVRDEGIGMAPDQLARIFEMFVQVDASIERTANGLGIGLTLVKNLVEMHGGTVTAHSAGVGHGSEVVVRLPIAIAGSKSADDVPRREESGVFRRDGLLEDSEGRERTAP